MAGAAYDWEEAAFGLLPNSGADANEGSSGGWLSWCCGCGLAGRLPSTWEASRVCVRFAQFKSASPRMSVAQHCALLSVLGQSVT